MRFPQPLPPRARTTFSGWRIVALSAVALGMTGPAQTAGVSVFVDPMIETLDVTRSQLSTAYLIGTLAGAAAMPRIGRFMDDRGARVALAVVAGTFGLMLAAMAGVTGLLTLTLGLAGLRMFGRGGLQLIAVTSVAPWFDRRRGTAIGVTTAAGASILSLVPLLSAVLISSTTWRTAWLLLAGLVWIVLLPIAFRGLINRPADVGQRPDGSVEPVHDPDDPVVAVGTGYTRAQALRTPMFWAITGGIVATGLVETGLAFHQIDLLGEQGLSPFEAAANFLPQTVSSLLASLLVGVMVDRFATRWVLLASMSSLVLAMLSVPFVQPGLRAIGYGVAVGAASASIEAAEAASFPKLFGVRHLGAIRGVVAFIGVAATAFGPLALSIGHDLTGGYVRPLMVLTVLPIAAAAVGMFAPEVRPIAPAGPDEPVA